MVERIAGEYLDRCRAEIDATVGQMRCLTPAPELSREMHRSVSVLLRTVVHRLQHHSADLVLLPPALHERVGRWKTDVTRELLERVVTLRITQWRDAMLELLRRLDDDWTDLVRTFGLRPEAKLASISEPKGDLHNFGRSVCTVTLDDGHTVVYKPRSVDPEEVFGRVVKWLEPRVCPTLKSCAVLARPSYGWTEFVQARLCATSAEAEAFFERQGGFLALFFLLNGGDCLGENFVGHGEHPIWIDTECVCAPHFADTGSTQGSALPDWMNRSILTTCFVFMPNQSKIPPRRLTGLFVSCTSDRSVVFDDRDTLREPYIQAVIRGFRNLYSGVLCRKDEWMAPGGPVSWWAGRCVRRVFQATYLYFALAEALLVVPEAERDELRQEVRRVLRGPTTAPSWFERIVEADMAALERADIPYWTLVTDAEAVTEAGGVPVSGVVTETGLQSLREHAERMSIQEMKNQLWVIDTFLRLSNSVAA